MRGVLHRIVARPAVYDLVQRMAGDHEVRRRLAPHFDGADGIVLDLGGGTGNSHRLVRRPASYVLVEPDPEKVGGFVQKRLPGAVVRGDATRLCFGDASVPTALCMAVAHHLDAEQFSRLFAEVARVVSRRFVFLDPVWTGALRSRALWRYDRGSHPRTADEIEAAMSAHFELEHAERFTIHHTYVLLVGRPRRA